MEPKMIDYGYITMYDTVMPDHLVDRYNNFTEEIEKFKSNNSCGNYFEILLTGRFKIIAEQCNPHHPNFFERVEQWS